MGSQRVGHDWLTKHSTYLINIVFHILLLNLWGIFRKEKRKEYIEYIEEANKVIKQNEERYLSALSEKTMECVELENEFLSLNNLPFILANG